MSSRDKRSDFQPAGSCADSFHRPPEPIRFPQHHATRKKQPLATFSSSICRDVPFRKLSWPGFNGGLLRCFQRAAAVCPHKAALPSAELTDKDWLSPPSPPCLHQVEALPLQQGKVEKVNCVESDGEHEPSCLADREEKHVSHQRLRGSLEPTLNKAPRGNGNLKVTLGAGEHTGLIREAKNSHDACFPQKTSPHVSAGIQENIDSRRRDRKKEGKKARERSQTGCVVLVQKIHRRERSNEGKLKPSFFLDSAGGLLSTLEVSRGSSAVNCAKAALDGRRK